MRFLGFFVGVFVALLTMSVAFADRTITFVPENNTSLTGTAVLIPRGQQTEIKIKITGAPADAVEGATVRIGDCVNGMRGVVHPLNNVVAGASDTVIDETIDDLSTLSRVIIINEPATNLSNFVACGVIPFQATLPKTGEMPSGFVVLVALIAIGSGLIIRRGRWSHRVS